MKNLLTVAGLFGVLLVFGLFVASEVSEAQTSVVASLLDLPAPPPPNPLSENSRSKRSEEFFSKKKVPDDDAPIEDLLDYWKAQNRFDPQTDFTVKPSSETLRRIFAEIEKEPETLAAFLNVLPRGNKEAAEFVKKIYDNGLGASGGGDDDDTIETHQLPEIKNWLTYNTDYFIEDLYKAAQQARDADEYVTNQQEVLALAALDWDRARPLLERMLANGAQPVSQTLARWAFYRHAVQENDAGDAERFRKDLQATVENKSGKPGDRDLAMDALVLAGDFEGRDEWYYKLLADETLHDLRSSQNSSYTGLTTLLNHSAPEKYLARMLELVRSDNRAVRSAAARNLSTLLDEKNLEVVRALLPWLENPDWAKQTGGERRLLVDALSKIEISESVPGLIAVLNEKASDVSADPDEDGVMSNTNVRTMSGGAARENYPFRNAAINALAKQKDVRAISPLRQLLPLVEEYERGNVVRALLASRGFSVPEQVEALEAVAQSVVAQMSAEEQLVKAQAQLRENYESLQNVTNAVQGETPQTVVPPRITVETNTAVVVNSMSNRNAARTYNPSDIKFVLGNQLVSISEIDGELVAAVINRIDELDKKNPPLAFALRKILQNWSGAAVNSLLLRDLKNGKSDANAVVKLLSVRGDLREKQAGEVHDLRAGDNPVALGVAACLLEDANGYDQILAGANADAKTAMLACARLVRAKLPVPTVAENLRAADKTLALAAERYLESEDSPEARRIVLSLHPNEAKILGATTAFTVANAKNFTPNRFLTELFSSVGDAPVMPYYMLYLYQDALEADEKLLQKEVKETEELLGVYAYDKNFIRIYKDKAVFSWEEDEARYRERPLSGEEFNRVKSYVAAQRADEMPPFLSACDGCESKELLMLGRTGGRRVFYRASRAPAFFAELERMFGEMREPPAQLRYRLEKSVAGLEVLFADENLQARTVWKIADDFRVLVDDRQRRKQIDGELNRLDELDMAKEDFDYEAGEPTLQKRRKQREYENFSWRKYEIEQRKLGDAVAQPPAIGYIPLRDGSAIQASDQQWKARTAANLEIRVGETDGLYKIVRGQTTKIRAGNYDKPAVTPDGRWAVLTKYDEETGAALVRVNLLTGKEFKIKTEENQHFEAVAFDASVNKMLIFSRTQSYHHYEAEEAAQTNGKYFLLDAETGLMQPGKGEFRPLAQQTFRALQPTATADEFWAAIPDAQKKETRVGIYNAKTFAFKLLLAVPQIKFDSMNLWADESAGKIYFVYEGHLLALPLPKAGK